jgi:hypothetical protein
MPSGCGPYSEEGPPEFTVGSFGDNLRRQREVRNISLEAISNSTKISIRMLRAIEDEHFDQLPGGVFNKGFVRAYARQVGSDEDEAVADYLVALHDSQFRAQALQPDFRQPDFAPPPPNSKHTGFLNLSGPIHGAQVRAVSPLANSSARWNKTSQIAEVGPTEADETGHRKTVTPASEDSSSEEVQIQIRDRRTQDRRGENRRVEERRGGERRRAGRNNRGPDNLVAIFPESLGHRAEQVPWIKLAMPLLLVALTLAFWNYYRRGQPAAELSHASIPTTVSAAAPDAFKPVASPLAPPTRAVTASTARRPAPANHSANHSAEIHSPDTALTVPVPAVDSPSKFTLVIRANKTSWVSIFADGQPVARETLIAPANTSIRAIHEIVVRTGNAAGISFLLNGKEVPAEGNPGEARTYTFNASGLRASAEAQPLPSAQ